MYVDPKRYFDDTPHAIYLTELARAFPDMLVLDVQGGFPVSCHSLCICVLLVDSPQPVDDALVSTQDWRGALLTMADHACQVHQLSSP